ncbi:hypothetical protein [Embleya sp. NPDC020886]|uniref:DUF7779 domain-containing protein n=1 Tax=Embleya sp. NPDC020886 TaxID=3363980 RepID=UPI0037894D96
MPGTTVFGPAGTFHAPVVINGRHPVPFPHRVGTLPPLADCWLERASQVEPAAPGVAPPCLVVTGLGGAGKTQIAAGLAHRAWEAADVDLLVWITANSRNAIVTGYARAGADVTGVADDDPEQAAARFLDWLAEPRGARWLIVLDDLQAPRDLARLWPPGHPLGRTVVTTRRRDSALLRGRQVCDVDRFTPEESLDYLRRKFDADERLLGEAELLAEDLGHLPLALSQAAAYTLDRDVSCADYRKRFADRRRRLADLVPDPDVEMMPDDYSLTVATTWSLSIEAADRLAPVGLARPLLELIGVLDPNAIPVEVLRCDAARALFTTGPATSTPSAEDADDALHNLRRLSLVTVADGLVRVHALVQRAAREALDPQALGRVGRAAADALRATWPETEDDHRLVRLVMANAETLVAQHGHTLLIGKVHALVNHVLYARGRNWSPNPLWVAEVYDRLHADAVRLSGAEHETSLDLRQHHIRFRCLGGDVHGVTEAMAEVLATRVRLFGPEHRETLSVRQDMAGLTGWVGEAEQAERMYGELAVDCARILGPDDPNTLSCRLEVLRWQAEAGEGAAQAVRTLPALVEDTTRALGPDHSTVLEMRWGLAAWYMELDDFPAAVEYLRPLVADMSRLWGEHHSKTREMRLKLADALLDSGAPADAAEQYAKIVGAMAPVAHWDRFSTHEYVNVFSKMLLARYTAGDLAAALAAGWELLQDGLRHWRHATADLFNVVNTIGNVATRYGKAADVDKAVEILTRLVETAATIGGPEVSSVLVARHNLAWWRGVAGDHAYAVAAFTELVAIRSRVFDPTDPEIVSTRTALAHWQTQAGDSASAAEVLDGLLSDLLSSSPIPEADLLGLMRSLMLAALRLQVSGEFTLAYGYFERLPALFIRYSGPDAQETLRIRHQAAVCRALIGERVEALAAEEALLADQVRVLGPVHSDTLDTALIIAVLRGLTGDPAGAHTVRLELLADLVRARGVEHVDTVGVLDGLEGFAREQREPAINLELWTELAVEYAVVLGVTHERTLAARRQRVWWLVEAGDIVPAAADAEALLADSRAVRAPHHPQTLEVLGEFAYCRDYLGDVAGALAAYREQLRGLLETSGADAEATRGVLPRLRIVSERPTTPGERAERLAALVVDYASVLGADALEVLWLRLPAADALFTSGDRDAGESAFVELLADCLRVLGPEHELTMGVRHDTAHQRGLGGDPEAAVTGLAELLADRLRVLGPTHSHTLHTRWALAHWRGAAGDVDTAVADLTRLLGECEAHLGAGDEQTEDIRRSLAHWREVAGPPSPD